MTHNNVLNWQNKENKTKWYKARNSKSGNDAIDAGALL